MHGLAVIFGTQRFRRRLRFLPAALILIGVLGAGRARALDRFAALSMLETGDDDYAHGRDAEISRYQIRREVWLQTTNTPVNEATNPAVALAVAQMIAQARGQQFATEHGRPATDFEFYVLWNSPAQIDRPGRAVRERARRFVNLINRPDDRPSRTPAG